MDTQKLLEEQKMELEASRADHRALQVRPESRGTIRIKSADPTVYPVDQPNYLSDPIDQQVAGRHRCTGRARSPPSRRSANGSTTR